MILSGFATIATFLLFLGADAQTPPNTYPSTDRGFVVTYGSSQVTPGMMLPVMGKSHSYSTISADLTIPRNEHDANILLHAGVP